jgi:hypothetical protein
MITIMFKVEATAFTISSHQLTIVTMWPCPKILNVAGIVNDEDKV